MLRYIIGLWLILGISACSLFPSTADDPKNWDAERYYQEAKAALKSEDFQTAIEYFEGLQTRYPFGTYAQQALLEIAYAYFRFDEPQLAISTANRFIKLHPRHEHVDYAYYLKGLANFYAGVGSIDDWFKQEVSDRDIEPYKQSFKDFRELIDKFPQSRYAEDARQRMIHLRNQLARNEYNTALFYQERKAYAASANRAKYILEHFQGSPYINGALDILAQSYKALGLDSASQDTLKVKSLNPQPK